MIITRLNLVQQARDSHLKEQMSLKEEYARNERQCNNKLRDLKIFEKKREQIVTRLAERGVIVNSETDWTEDKEQIVSKDQKVDFQSQYLFSSSEQRFRKRETLAQ